MERKRCPCGRVMTLPRGILGRTDEMLKIKGVKFWPSQVDTVLREFSEYKGRCRVIVSSEKGVDRLKLLIEGGEWPKDEIEKLSRRLKQETLLIFDKIEMEEKLDEGSQVIDQRKGITF